MNQLTVRGFDKDLERLLRAVARERGVSLNQAALILMRQGAGLGAGRRRPNTVGDSLDHLIGRWSSDEGAELEAAVEILEKVDEPLWR